MTDQNKKPENPPAFPGNFKTKGMDRGGYACTVVEYREGMTLLDVFAKEAMGSLLVGEGWESIPKSAYDMAEMMLAERTKRGIK